jgi:Inhibitor of vertebrate lysozyme (Ivy)
MKLWGGVYAQNCADPAAPRLRVAPDVLSVEQGSQRMVARNVDASYSFFGNSPPKDFQVALMGEARGGLQILFVVYKDRSGEFITLDGDPKVRAALGKPLLAAKHRRCDGQGAPMATLPSALATPAASAAPPAATTNLVPAPGGPPDIPALLADRRFKNVYLRAIGPKASERWLAQMDGPSPPTRAQTVEGVPYVVIAVCKPHDCYDHNAVFLYSASQDRVLGLIQQSNVKTLIGLPPPPLAAQLERLWQTEWRQK